MTNMSGAQQTRICRRVTKELRAEFALHDAEAGNHLEEEAEMSAFLSVVIAGARKGLAKAPTMFSAAVTTTLSDGSTITVLTPERSGTFVEWLTAAMGVWPDTSVEAVAQLLRERGHLINSAQVEEMKKRTDRSEKTGMRTDGWGNWLPRTDGDHVTVGRVHRSHLLWHDYNFGLGGSSGWHPDHRILLCNLDPSKIGI